MLHVSLWLPRSSVPSRAAISRLSLGLIPEVLSYKLPMTKNGWWVSVPGARRVSALNKHPSRCIYSDVFPGWQVDEWNREAPNFHKFRQFIHWLQKLQPKIESNEYSSTRGSPISRLSSAGLPVSIPRNVIRIAPGPCKNTPVGCPLPLCRTPSGTQMDKETNGQTPGIEFGAF